jgi:hypothetical protein
MYKFILIIFICTNLLAKELPSSNEFKVYKDKPYKLLFFKIYDLKISTKNSKEVDYKQAHIFQYRYNRDVDAVDLVSKTTEEWERLQLCNEEHAIRWSKELKSMWPDIKKGDSLTAYFDGEFTYYYHNNKYLGEIKGRIFARTFFQIWLDPNSRMTELHED